MVFTVRHATVTFQTDGDTWREQKEKKAALMVGILIGVFVLCWIPFFITELIVPLCSCDIPPIWKSIFLWLGYSNSFFNPLIYTAFNKNYNNALKNLFSRQRWAARRAGQTHYTSIHCTVLLLQAEENGPVCTRHSIIRQMDDNQRPSEKLSLTICVVIFVLFITLLTSQLDWNGCLSYCVYKKRKRLRKPC